MLVVGHSDSSSQHFSARKQNGVEAARTWPRRHTRRTERDMLRNTSGFATKEGERRSLSTSRSRWARVLSGFLLLPKHRQSVFITAQQPASREAQAAW